MKKKRKTKISGCVEEYLGYAAEHAPELLQVAATLFPFRDVIGCFSTGPQCDEHCDPWFGVQVSYADDMMVVAEITANCIAVQDLMRFEGEWHTVDKGTMTLDQLHDFLRQVPRPASSFLTSNLGGR